MTKLPDINKDWKPLFIRVTNPIGFGVDLQWLVAKAGGNKAPTLSLQEQKDYQKIMDNENDFPWMLVQEREEVENYQLSAILLASNPPIVVPIDPEFQIGEPSWASFTFHGTFYALDTLFF